MMSADLPTGATVLVVGGGRAGSSAIGRSLIESDLTVIEEPDYDAAVATARAHSPDAVVIDASRSEPAALETCRRLHHDLTCSSLPILLVLHDRPRRERVLEALQAGAWHVFSSPLDVDELRLRIALYSAPHRQSDRATNVSLVDAETGLYNPAGLARRGRELSSEATRQHKQLGFVALGVDINAPLPPGAAARCGHVLREAGRLSDVVGRLGPMEFLVLAPATDQNGAALLTRRLAHTLRSTLERALPPGSHVRLSAGFAALPSIAYAPVEPTELLSRATSAFRVGALSPDFAWLSEAEIEGPLE